MPSVSRLRIVLPLFAALAVIAAVTPGCFGRECDGGYVEYGNHPGEGSFIDGDTWQSTPLDGPWLNFPAQRTYGIIIGDWAVQKRQFYSQLASVSADLEPNKQPACTNGVCDPETNWAPGAGNIAQFSYARAGFIKITNNTCAQFYLRLVLKAYPVPPAPADAGSDALTDAPTDLTPDSAASDASSG